MPTHRAQFVKIDLAEHYKQGEKHEHWKQWCHDGLEKGGCTSKGGHKGKNKIEHAACENGYGQCPVFYKSYQFIHRLSLSFYVS